MVSRVIVRTENEKTSRLVMKVQAFCEAKGLDHYYEYLDMLNPKTNVGKLINVVFTI